MLRIFCEKNSFQNKSWEHLYCVDLHESANTNHNQLSNPMTFSHKPFKSIYKINFVKLFLLMLHVHWQQGDGKLFISEKVLLICTRTNLSMLAGVKENDDIFSIIATKSWMTRSKSPKKYVRKYLLSSNEIHQNGKKTKENLRFTILQSSNNTNNTNSFSVSFRAELNINIVSISWALANMRRTLKPRIQRSYICIIQNENLVAIVRN